MRCLDIPERKVARKKKTLADIEDGDDADDDDVRTNWPSRCATYANTYTCIGGRRK